MGIRRPGRPLELEAMQGNFAQGCNLSGIINIPYILIVVPRFKGL